MVRLGTPGYLSCLAFSMLLAMLTSGWRTAAACAMSIVLALVFYPAGLAPLRRGWLWLMVTLLVLSSVLLGDATNRTHALLLGAEMSLRAVAIVVGVTGFAASVSVAELASLLECVGMRGLGFALGVAFNMLPVVQDTALTSYHALRLRGGFRRARLQAIRLLLVTTVVNSLRHVDDIVCAAEARAFSVENPRSVTIQWRPLDARLAIGLLAAAGLVFV